MSDQAADLTRVGFVCSYAAVSELEQMRAFARDSRISLFAHTKYSDLEEETRGGPALDLLFLHAQDAGTEAFLDHVSDHTTLILFSGGGYSEGQATTLWERLVPQGLNGAVSLQAIVPGLGGKRTIDALNWREALDQWGRGAASGAVFPCDILLRPRQDRAAAGDTLALLHGIAGRIRGCMLLLEAHAGASDPASFPEWPAIEEDLGAALESLRQLEERFREEG